MRQYDLLASEVLNVNVSCDVCIIGAGAAGIYLTKKLALLGHSVVILEAGNRTCSDGISLGIEPKFSDQIYPGATVGRAFGLGGSTSRWGGLLVPYSRHDVRVSDSGRFDPWQFIVSTVEVNSTRVLSNFGIGQNSDFETYPGEKLHEYSDVLKLGGIDMVSAKLLPFKMRNFTHLINEEKVKNSNIDIFLNAITNNWSVNTVGNGQSRINIVGAIAANGNTVQVSAKHVVVAAGAIESARILLELRRSVGLDVINPMAEVGNNLSDHLSCKIACVKPQDYSSIANIFGPRFDRSWMRTFRFIESNQPSDTPRYFSHFIFNLNNPGIGVAKEVLSSLQAKKLPNLTASQVVVGGGGLISLAYSRYIQSRLFIPKVTSVHLQLDIEQVPTIANSISLSDEVDRYGRPVARVSWRINDVDYTNIEQTAIRILNKWPKPGGIIPELVPILNKGSARKPHDTYHPVGTCRMGNDDGAVVDSDLRVRGSENLWVLSTGVLPSAGTANPTFTMLCLGERLADNLSLELNRYAA